MPIKIIPVFTFKQGSRTRDHFLDYVRSRDLIPEILRFFELVDASVWVRNELARAIIVVL